MKIKFKQQNITKINNITFNINSSKTKSQNKLINKPKINRKYFISIQKQYEQYLNGKKFFSEITEQAQQVKQQKKCLLMNSTGFIPKSANIRSSLFLTQREQKMLKGLQPARLQQKNFPMRKILTRRSTLSSFIKKDKNFQFSNPQLASNVFMNKTITKNMLKSSSFFTKKQGDIFNKTKWDTSLNNKLRKTSDSFRRYDVQVDMGQSSVSLAFDQKAYRYAALNRLSQPIN